MSSISEEIEALRRRLAEIERMAAEQRPDAAGPEMDVNEYIRRVSAQGRGTGSNAEDFNTALRRIRGTAE